MRKRVSEILQKFYEKKTGQQKIKKRHGVVIWLTGLPGSGKTTIAVRLKSLLSKKGYNAFTLDADIIRRGLNKDLGFSPEDRHENIRRVGEVAKLFAEAGFLVIVSFISPYRKDRDVIRRLLPTGNFIEVYVKASLSTCEKRDPRGLYKKARCGEIKEFTGISAPYEEPTNPELIIDTENHTEEESAWYLLEYLIKRLETG